MVEGDLRRRQRFEHNTATIHPSSLQYHPLRLLVGLGWPQDRTILQEKKGNPSKAEAHCRHFVRSPEPSRLAVRKEHS